MLIKRIVVVVSAVACWHPMLEGQEATQQLLIERIGGKWEVQAPGQSPRPMGGKYDVLTTAFKIHCLELPCSLSYSTEREGKIVTDELVFPIPPKRLLTQWILVPAPKDPPVARMAAELQQIIGRIGIRGGASKASPACSGDLQLVSPSCGETVDAADFRLKWINRPTEAGKALTLLVNGADSSERRRWDFISADAGEFRDASLGEYLASLQLPDRATDVTIRLMRTESFSAVRLLSLLSRADYAEYQKKLTAWSLLPDLARNLKLLEQFLRMRMWSRAADIARELLRNAPESLEIRKYALVGLCGSDFADDIAKLRSSLKDAGVTGFCESERSPQ
jgi:hypothetical protein